MAGALTAGPAQKCCASRTRRRMKQNYCMDLHTHTIVSGHAYNTMNEMIRTAADKGLTILGISDHAPAMPGSACKSYFQNMGILSHEKYGIRVLYGAELNIMDYRGSVDLDANGVRSLDYCIASLHRNCLTPGSEKENTAAYIGAMEQEKVIIIGHPDDGHFSVNYDELVLEAKRHRTLIELNNSSLSPRGFRIHALENDRRILALCMKYGVPVILGSDAHREEDIAEFGLAADLLKELSFPQELIINTSPEKLQEWLPGRETL